MGHPDVNVVLVRPRHAGNLGGVARAMKNGGVSRLSLVDSRVRNWTEARAMAVHAGDVLDGAEKFDGLEAALANATWVVGTTMRPLPNQCVLTPREFAMEAATRGHATLVFGDEESGLQNAELLRCNATARVAASVEQPSLNLAQAVMVFMYELAAVANVAPGLPLEPMATGALLNAVEKALREALSASPFTDLDRPKHGVVDLMQTLRRANLTETEGRVWMAALTSLGRKNRRSM